MAEISINFTSKGADKTLRELDGINTNADKAADSLFRMAQVLKTASNIRLNEAVTNLGQIGKDLGTVSRSFNTLGQSTKNVEDRIKEYATAQARIGQLLNAPIASVNGLIDAFGRLPQVIEPIAARFQELKAIGLDSSQSFKILRQELNLTKAEFAALSNAANSAARAQKSATRQDQIPGTLTDDQQKLAIQKQQEISRSAIAGAQAIQQAQKETSQSVIKGIRDIGEAQKEVSKDAIAQVKAVSREQINAQKEAAEATLTQARAVLQAQREAAREANRLAIEESKTLSELQREEQRRIAEEQKRAAKAAAEEDKRVAKEKRDRDRAAAEEAKAAARELQAEQKAIAREKRQQDQQLAAEAKALAKAQRDEERAAAKAKKEEEANAAAEAKALAKQKREQNRAAAAEAKALARAQREEERAAAKAKRNEEKALAKAQRDEERAAAQAQKEIQSSVNQTSKELAAASREAQQLTNALNQGKQIPDDEVERVANGLAEAQRNAAKLATQFDLTEQQARQLGTNVERAKKATVELSKAADTATQDFSEALDFAGEIGEALARAGAAILAVGAEAFLSFENAAKQFSILSSASGATAEQIKAVEVEAKLLGATTAFTAADVQNLAVELTRMGVNADDIESSLSGIVAGSLATGEDLSRIGEVTGRALTQFQLSGDQAVRVVDILGVTAANSATDVDQVGEALSYVGGQANASNQSIETTSLLLGILANAGITGSRAGTNLGAVFDNLKKGSADLANGLDSDAARAFQSLGVDIRNTDGSLKDFGEILPELRQNFSALTVQQQENIETSLFGERGGRAFTALMQASDESVQQLSQSIAASGGFSEGAAEQMRQGLSGALIELSSATEAATSEIFATFAPAAEAIVRAATALLSGFTQLPAPLQFALTSLGTFVAILGAATAAVAAYNIAQGPLIVKQTLLAAATVKKNLVTAAGVGIDNRAVIASKAKAAAKTLEAIATNKVTLAELKKSVVATKSIVLDGVQATASKGLAAAKLVYAVATGKATLAANSFAAAQLAALAPMALVVGVLAAIGAALALNVAVYMDVNDAANELNKSAKESEDRLQALRDSVEQEGIDTGNLLPVDQVERNIAEIEENFNLLTDVISFVRSDILGLASATEVAASRSTVAFGKLIEKGSELEEEILNLLFGLEDGEILPPEVAQTATEALEAEIEALRNARPVTEQDAELRDQRIRQLENTLRLVQDNSSAQEDNTNAVEEGTTAAEANAQALQRIQNELAKNNAELQRDAARRRAELAETGIGGEEFARRNEQIERESLERRLQINEDYLNDLRQQAARDPGNQEVQDALLEAETEYYDTRTEIAENAREEAERIEKERQDALKEAQELAQAEIDRANTERQRSILELEQQLRAAGRTEEEIAEQTAQATLDAERESIEARVELQQDLIKETEAGSTERAQAELQLAELQNDLLANQIAAERQFREAQKQAEERAQEEAIKAVEEQIAANQRLVNEQIAGAESSLKAQQRIEDSLERQNKLLQQQRNLNNAINALRDAVGNRQVAQATSALEIQRELAQVTEELDTNSELSAEEREQLTNRRLQLEQQLGRLGVQRGITEQEALQRVIAAQARRFDQEREALNRQQAIERSTLELEIQRSRIAAERAVREQEIALRRLDLQRQEILGEIEIARIRGDEQAALDAESRLRILDDVILGERDLLRIQQEAAATEEQSANVQRQTLAAQQQAAQLSLAEQQEQRALELAREAATVGGAAQSQAESLANQTANRATAEANAATALAASLDNTVQLNQETETLVNQTRVLADEAERYRRAIGGGTAAPANVPSFKVGGIAPGGLTQVHKDEFIYLPQGAQIASQRLSRQAQRQIAQAGALAQSMGTLNIGSLPNVLAHPKIELRSKDMELLRRDFQKLAKMLERQGPPRIELEQTFVGEVETSVKKASEDVWRVGHRMGIL